MKPKGRLYQWVRVRLKGKRMFDQHIAYEKAGYTPVPFSRHRKEFPRTSNVNGCICVCGHILMEKKHV